MKSIALDPEYERPVWNLAMTEYRLGNFDAAATGFEKALTLDNTDEYSHYWSALSYYELKQYPKALKHINVYISKQKTDGDGFFNRAKIEAATGNKSAARADYKESLRLYKIANDQDGVSSATQSLAALDKP